MIDFVEYFSLNVNSFIYDLINTVLNIALYVAVAFVVRKFMRLFF